MTVTRGIGKAAVAAAWLGAIPMAASGLGPPPPAAPEVSRGAVFVQFTYPWEEEEKKKERAPKARPAKPPGAGDSAAKPPAAGATSPAAAPSAVPSSPSSIEEVAHKGQVIRAVHFASTSTLQIELNGKVIGTVRDVGEVKKPRLMPGTYQSLVVMWTKNVAQDCSSHVLVAVPMSEAAGGAEVKPGFGACNTATRQLITKRGNWEAWSLIAFREDSPKVSVAISRDGKLAITQHAAKPCLFAKDTPTDTLCSEEYVAAGLGSADRGVQSGEERAAGRRLATFHNRAKSTGSAELDGKPYKTFSNLKTFHVEGSVALPDSVLFTLFLQPANEACGYRTLLRIPTAADGTEQVLDRVGVCRPKAATTVRRRPDRTVSAWAAIMWRDGDQQVDIAAWSGGSVTLSVAPADACLFNKDTQSNDCIGRMLPANIVKSAPAVSGTPGVQPTLPLAGFPWGAQAGQNPAVLKGFLLLSLNRIDTALAEFDRALIAEPNNALAYTGRGFGLALRGKLDNAMSDLDRAVQLNPRSAHAFSFRGFVFLLRNEPDRALTQLDQALLLDARQPYAYAFRGSAWLAKGDTDRALTDLNKSIAMAPKNSIALGMRGMTYAKRTEHQKAVDDFTAAIALAPNSIPYRLNRGQSFEALGRTKEALEDYNAAGTMKPVTLGDIASQIIARQRAGALAGRAPAARENCPKGQQCL